MNVKHIIAFFVLWGILLLLCSPPITFLKAESDSKTLTENLTVIKATSELQDEIIDSNDIEKQTDKDGFRTVKGKKYLEFDTMMRESTLGYQNTEILRVQLENDDTQLTVICESCGTFRLSNSEDPSRKIWKDIYIAKDGKIVLDRREYAKIIPPSGEKIEWKK